MKFYSKKELYSIASNQEYKLKFSIFLILLLFFIFGILYDNISIANGLGFDGETYGYYVKENIIKNISFYYAHRVLPSIIVKSIFNIFNISPTEESIVNAFHLLNTFLFIFTIILAFKIAAKASMSLKQLYFLITLLFFNYFSLKITPFYPVTTDYPAFFLSTLLLYSYISNKFLLGLVCFIAGLFTFPTIAPTALILFLLKLSKNKKNNIVFSKLVNFIHKKRPLNFLTLFILLIYGFLVVRLLFFWIQDISNFYFWSREKLNLTSSILSAIINISLLFIFNSYIFKFFQTKILHILEKWSLNIKGIIATFLTMILVYLLLKYFVINQEIQSPTNFRKFIDVILLMSVQKPLLAISSHISFWGLVVVLSLIFYKEIIKNTENYGPSIFFLLAIYVNLLFLISESRLLVTFLPFLAFQVAISIPQKILNTKFLVIHSLISLIFSRFWIKFDDLYVSFNNDATKFDSWYFNMGGPWTSNKGYWLLITVSFALFFTYFFLIKKLLQTNENPRSQTLS